METSKGKKTSQKAGPLGPALARVCYGTLRSGILQLNAEGTPGYPGLFVARVVHESEEVGLALSDEVSTAFGQEFIIEGGLVTANLPM